MIYDSKTWTMKNKLTEKLERTEMKMIQHMHGMKLNDSKTSVELRERMVVNTKVCLSSKQHFQWEWK